MALCAQAGKRAYSLFSSGSSMLPYFFQTGDVYMNDVCNLSIYASFISGSNVFEFFIDTSSSLSGYLFIIVISFPCNHFITISK